MVFAWFAVFVWWLFGLVCVGPLRLVAFLGFVLRLWVLCCYFVVLFLVTSVLLLIGWFIGFL